MKAAHFRVCGLLDMASRPSYGTVTIDRVRGLFTVRPLRRRRVYELQLSTVAEMVCRAIIRAEARAKLTAKLESRKARRRR